MTRAYRHADDVFDSVLQKARKGELDADADAFLVALGRDLPQDCEPVRLHGLRKKVDEYNDAQLELLNVSTTSMP